MDLPSIMYRVQRDIIKRCNKLFPVAKYNKTNSNFILERFVKNVEFRNMVFVMGQTFCVILKFIYTNCT